MSSGRSTHLSVSKLNRLKCSGQTNINHLSSMLRGMRRNTLTEIPKAGDALKPLPASLIGKVRKETNVEDGCNGQKCA
ncbi:hypothetical protein DPMN_085174 [Dreissena polymorpha]|uniref:Uncharacterized protein n=1 Tax=Dreissena polymorpha TaxID=45954 RepID=A0A9D3YC61_DREPO|nr:hypothetical protein DPMN_085174 [Dreissena polymorpha]